MDYLEVVHVLIRRANSSSKALHQTWEAAWSDHPPVGLYLSPMIDCFDGLVVSWIGSSRCLLEGANAGMVCGLRISVQFALFLLRAAAHNRNNWLFAGSLKSGQRVAAVMSLIQSAKLNGHDPYAYLKDVLVRLSLVASASCGICCRALPAPPEK